MFCRTRTSGVLLLLGFASGLAKGELPLDVHSYARPNEVVVKDVALDLTVDFDAKRLVGSAVLTIERGPAASEFSPLVLDERGLAIERIEASDDGRTFRPVPYDVTTPEPVLGSKLAIRVAPTDRRVRIRYATDPDATALQWLPPALTAGKKAPFLFTQSQAIHARSWIPIQDSPGIRVTYSATIRVPKGLTAVMSAERVGRDEAKNAYKYVMKEPIPPYLIALGAGDIAFKALGDRTGVYAEPATLEKAAHEFADAEKMVASVEKRFGPYRWGRYDILVLPPSFPFGGMENPRLTFATPTVLAGDRSLVSLIAHELAHSWSGNLVTNATWSDFWLNEGFTTYLEQRIIEDLYGKPRADVERVLGLRDLREEVAALPPKDQILEIDLSGRDPDDGVTRIPYEKGALLLATLEQLVGREAFDQFLLDYFNRHAFRSIVTATFVDDLNRELLSKHPEAAKKIDLKAWLTTPGIPKGHAQPTAPALAAIDKASKAWLAGPAGVDGLKTEAWSTQEWLHFLQGLPADLSLERMKALDEAFGLSKRENAEIAFQWLLLAIRRGYEPADERLEAHLVGIGRRKLIVPLYKELMKTDSGKAKAKRIYAKARPGYHPIAVKSVDDVVGKP